MPNLDYGVTGLIYIILCVYCWICGWSLLLDMYIKCIDWVQFMY